MDFLGLTGIWQLERHRLRFAKFGSIALTRFILDLFEIRKLDKIEREFALPPNRRASSGSSRETVSSTHTLDLRSFLPDTRSLLE